MKRLCVILLVFVLGCSASGRSDFAMVRDVLALAKEDKVAGKLKVHLNGNMEAGLNEGVYFGSPGSVVEADLEFHVEGIKPANPANSK